MFIRLILAVMKRNILFVLVLFLPLLLRGQTDTTVQPIAITHVTLIDGTGAPAEPDMTVVITGNRITEVGENPSIPKQSQLVNARGKFLIPGLWDMHSHIHRREDLALFVANGVTGLRIMAALPEINQMRADITNGQLLGPRMAIGSRLMDGSGDAGQTIAVTGASDPELAQEWSSVMSGGRPRSIVVRNRSDAQQAVNQAKSDGAEWIKIHEGLSREAYFALADESKRQGIPFVGHVPALVSVAEASDAGQRSIEHLQGVLVACSTRESELRAAPPGTRTQRLIAETFNVEKAESLAARFVRNNTWQCPTLTSRYGTKERSLRQNPSLQYVAAEIRSRWEKAANAIAPLTPEEQMVSRLTDEKLFEVVGIMHRAGVQFIVGTDVGGAFLVPGFSIHDELSELVKAGFTPMEALRAATRDAARFLGREKESGTIQKGKLADLVLLDANPLQSIRNTQKIRAVILNGRLLDRKALDAELAQVKEAANKKF